MSDALRDVRPLKVRGARLCELTCAADSRGRLTAAEVGAPVPFEPRRVFTVSGVPSEHVRGEHAHRRCEQFLICQTGSLAVTLDDGRDRDEVVLGSPAVGLYLPAMVWGVQHRYTPDAVLIVLASRPYEPDDYIRDYDEFRALAGDDHVR